MINDSRISRERKRELEQPDPFLESLYKGVETAKQYKKQIALASGLIFAIICIVSGTLYMIRSSEIKASEMLADAMESYDPQEPQKGYDAAASRFDTLLETYPNTASGRLATIRYGDMAYAAGRYEKARDLYIAAMDAFRGDPVVEDLLRFSLGHTCQELGKKDEAVRYFGELAKNERAFTRMDAQFQLGMIAMESGDVAKALEWMEKVASGDGMSIHKTMADTILAQN